MAEREHYELREPSRDADVKVWWFDVLRARGFTVAQVEVLLERRDLYLHDVVDLLDRGCSVELAFDICA